MFVTIHRNSKFAAIEKLIGLIFDGDNPNKTILECRQTFNFSSDAGIALRRFHGANVKLSADFKAGSRNRIQAYERLMLGKMASANFAGVSRLAKTASSIKDDGMMYESRWKRIPTDRAMLAESRTQLKQMNENFERRREKLTVCNLKTHPLNHKSLEMYVESEPDTIAS